MPPLSAFCPARGRLLALPALLLLGACAAPLPYRALDPGLAQARADFLSRRAEGGELAHFLAAAGERLPQTGEAWRFDALALVAGWYSAEVAAAQARWQAALQRRQDGRLAPAAALDLLAEHHSLTDSSRPQAWTLGLGFEFTLPSADRQAARGAQLDAAAELARIELAQAFWEARRRVREPWLRAIQLAQRMPLMERELSLLQERSARIETRVRLGESAPADRLAAHQAVEQAASALAAARRQQAAALAELDAALGLPADAPVPLLESVPPAGAAAGAPADAALHAALDNRLDLRAAEARFQAADAELRWEVAQQYPELGIRPGYEWDQGDHRLRIGLTLPLALPTAHRAQVRQAEAERELRARELRGRQDQVMRDASLALRALDDGVAERGERQRACDLARTATAAVLAGQQHGELDALQVGEARLAELACDQQLLAAEQELAGRLARFEDVVQRPLDQIGDAAEHAAGTRGTPAHPGEGS